MPIHASKQKSLNWSLFFLFLLIYFYSTLIKTNLVIPSAKPLWNKNNYLQVFKGGKRSRVDCNSLILKLMAFYRCPGWCSSVHPNLVHNHMEPSLDWEMLLILSSRKTPFYKTVAIILGMDGGSCKIWDICWHCSIQDIHTLNTLWHTRFGF